MCWHGNEYLTEHGAVYASLCIYIGVGCVCRDVGLEQEAQVGLICGQQANRRGVVLRYIVSATHVYW